MTDSTQRDSSAVGCELAFAVAIMRCGGLGGQNHPPEFRLTIDLRKHGGRWRVVHERDSVAATSW